MNEQLTWEAIRREALALEITALESDGHVFLHQCGSGQCGRFGESLAGCEAAVAWLAEVRHAIEIRDHLRSMEPQRRRRMLVRYLWRR
jgi:hypothetical protein